MQPSRRPGAHRTATNAESTAPPLSFLSDRERLGANHARCSFTLRQSGCAFFISGDLFELRGQLPSGLLPDSFSFSVADAGAFKSVIETKDTVTALRAPREVSEILSRSHETERAHLFPITNSSRVSAVLFASDIAADLSALELVAGLASNALERKVNPARHSQIDVIEVPLMTHLDSPALEQSVLPEQRAPATQAKLPAWADLPVDQRQLHIRAQRFARVTVAELQLARPEACRAGREQGDLYLFLKREIDKARENYRKQFMTVPSMVDYLHLELIQTAAHGDEQKLGADYPGRLL